jgi:hypothetical protein
MEEHGPPVLVLLSVACNILYIIATTGDVLAEQTGSWRSIMY